MRKYYSDLDRLHHAFPPSYNRDVPGFVDDRYEEEEMSETISTATQEAISALRTIAASDWLGQITPTLAGVVVDYIASLEARNEAMAAVVAAAKQMRYVIYGEEDWEAMGDALDALDAQAGEVT